MQGVLCSMAVNASHIYNNNNQYVTYSVGGRILKKSSNDYTHLLIPYIQKKHVILFNKNDKNHYEIFDLLMSKTPPGISYLIILVLGFLKINGSLSLILQV